MLIIKLSVLYIIRKDYDIIDEYILDVISGFIGKIIDLVVIEDIVCKVKNVE